MMTISTTEVSESESTQTNTRPPGIPIGSLAVGILIFVILIVTLVGTWILRDNLTGELSGMRSTDEQFEVNGNWYAGNVIIFKDTTTKEFVSASPARAVGPLVDASSYPSVEKETISLGDGEALVVGTDPVLEIIAEFEDTRWVFDTSKAAPELVDGFINSVVFKPVE